MTIDPPDSTHQAPATDIVPSQAEIPHAPHPSDARPLPAVPVEALPPQKKTRRWRSLSVAGGIALLIGIVTWSWWNDGAPPAQFKTASVDRGPITSIVTATGTVNPVVSVQVGSQVSGKVANLSADFNSIVTKGQVLAQIDQQPFKARVRQARAALKSATGLFAKANNFAAQRKRERDRMAELRPQAFVSQADLDLAETNYRDAVAHVDVLRALLRHRGLPLRTAARRRVVVADEHPRGRRQLEDVLEGRTPVAKIERGHEKDLIDVRAMFGRGMIEAEKLRSLFNEIAPLLYRYPAIDPSTFANNVGAFIDENT